VVDLMPKVQPIPSNYDEIYSSPEGEALLQAAERAAASGNFSHARMLHKKSIERFSKAFALSRWTDQLNSLRKRINEGEEEAKRAAEAVDPPFWSVSQHLNLTEQQVAQLEEWVGAPVMAANAMFVASQHGFESREFHRRCDGVAPSLVLVRTATGHIFGGYTSQPWSKGILTRRPPRWSPKMVEDKHAFVFRLYAPPDWVPKSYKDVFGEDYEQDIAKPLCEALSISIDEEDGNVDAMQTSDVPDGQRWCLDVPVSGISNITGGVNGSSAQHEPCILRRSYKEPDVAPVRHVWCKGPCFTHALEIDLDDPQRSFSDLLSGAIFHMPPGVPNDQEKLFLAGKLGGRTMREADSPLCSWTFAEVAVIKV